MLRVSFGLAVLVAAVTLPSVAEVEPTTAHVHVLDTLPVPTFEPDDVYIRAGDLVEWDNHSHRIHTVTHATCPRIDMRFTNEECAFDSKRDAGEDLDPGDFFTVTFDAPGIFEYLCAIHRFGATITVLGDESALPDLVVDEVTTHETPLRTSTRVQAIVGNDSSEASAPVSRLWFEIRSRDGGAWTQFGDARVGPLSPGQRRTINHDLTSFNKLGDFEIRVTADGAKTVVESDETNNVRSIVAAILLPPDTANGIALPDPPPPEPITTRIPSP